MSQEGAAFPWLTNMSRVPKSRTVHSVRKGGEREREHTGRVDGSGNKSEQRKRRKLK